ncbi:hypothetical protein DPMN_107150 [Dreissena polymorpha]|uniref:Uncharacterized protein n=1 Tax=Dreissena polymorpha TaxID=45954 RepID=A0A9D4QJV8_DREPO|nr:hypothetical protein DPMN_107150 [Dreissena polymorpha]
MEEAIWSNVDRRMAKATWSSSLSIDRRMAGAIWYDVDRRMAEATCSTSCPVPGPVKDR